VDPVWVSLLGCAGEKAPELDYRSHLLLKE
jgi:hypothetical protein